MADLTSEQAARLSALQAKGDALTDAEVVERNHLIEQRAALSRAPGVDEPGLGYQDRVGPRESAPTGDLPLSSVDVAERNKAPLSGLGQLSPAEEARRRVLAAQASRSPAEITELAALRARVEPGYSAPSGAKPLSDADVARLAELRSMQPDPGSLPGRPRTPAEEAELVKLADAEAAAEAARTAKAPAPTPRERLAALKAKSPHPAFVPIAANIRNEGEEVEFRRLSETIANEDRLAELRKMARRTPEQEAEMVALVDAGTAVAA